MVDAPDAVLPQVAEGLSLTLLDDTDEADAPPSSPRVYFTNVQDLRPGLLALALPMRGTHYVVVPLGQTVAMEYTRQGAAYQLIGQVVKVDLEHQPALLWVKCPDPACRVQRRHYVRLPVHLKLQFRPLVVAGEDKKTERPWLTAVALDISGGGLLLQTDAQLKRGEVVELRLELARQVMFINGEIVRVGEVNTALSPPQTECGLQFVDIDWSLREEIIKYIFAEQRRRLQHEQGLGRGWT